MRLGDHLVADKEVPDKSKGQKSNCKLPMPLQPNWCPIFLGQCSAPKSKTFVKQAAVFASLAKKSIAPNAPIAR